jgi:hypothetical protein
MTVSDIASFACETTGDISSEALDYAKRALKLKYATLYDAHNWRESMRVSDPLVLDPTANGAIFLPYDAEEVIFCSLSYDGLNFIRLTYRERDWIERFGGAQITLPGNTPWFYRSENLAWPSFSPGHFTFTTTDKSSFELYIRGIDQNGYPASDDFLMQGTVNTDGTVTPSSVTTVNFYKYVTNLSKGPTSVPLTIHADNYSTNIVIPPSVSELVFTQFVLAPPPVFTNPDGSARQVWVRTMVKLKPDALDNDMSVPRISHIWDALICFVTGTMYKRLGQVGKSQAEEQAAMGHVAAAVNVEKNQSEMRQQAVPAAYESGNYLDRGYYERATSWNPFAGP